VSADDMQDDGCAVRKYPRGEVERGFKTGLQIYRHR